jgi:hypothetical protein
MELQNRRIVADVKKLISEYFLCGQSRNQFCLEQGIKLGTFHWWMTFSRWE